MNTLARFHQIVALLALLAITGWGQIHQLSTAGIHSCAIKEGGQLYCWGANDRGQLGVGRITSTQTPEKILGEYQSVAVSRYHTCAVLIDGKVKCWGLNQYGQLGLEINQLEIGKRPEEIPEKLPALNLGHSSPLRMVKLGNYHACAVFKDGKLKCWGKNLNGELGMGSKVRSWGTYPSQMGAQLPFVNLGSLSKVEDLALGNAFSCALLEGGSVKCWGNAQAIGSGRNQDLGSIPSEMGDDLKPLDLGGKATRIAAGNRTACVILVSGKIHCWGSNDSGVLGAGYKETAVVGNEPNEMGPALKEVALGGLRADELACGYSHCCALLENQALKCWGSNTEGQLGLGDMISRGIELGMMGEELPFVNLGPFAVANRMALGSTHSCVVLKDQKLRCWGKNSFGQLGNKEGLSFGSLPGEMGEALPPVEF